MPSAITRWDPFTELRTRLDRMLDDLDGHERAWMPAIDVLREDGSLVVRADVPGVKPKEIAIEVADDVLTISGEHEETSEQEGAHHVRRERRYGSFSRSMALPPGVDAEKDRGHDPRRRRRAADPAPRAGQEGAGDDHAQRGVMTGGVSPSPRPSSPRSSSRSPAPRVDTGSASGRRGRRLGPVQRRRRGLP